MQYCSRNRYTGYRYYRRCFDDRQWKQTVKKKIRYSDLTEAQIERSYKTQDQVAGCTSFYSVHPAACVFSVLF